MNAGSGLSVASVDIGSHLCPVCGEKLDYQVRVGLTTYVCPQAHFQRQAHFSDIESKLYVGIPDEAA